MEEKTQEKSDSHSSHLLLISCAYAVPWNFAKGKENYNLKSNTDATYMKLIFTALISARSRLRPPLHREVATGAGIREIQVEVSALSGEKQYNKGRKEVALVFCQGNKIGLISVLFFSS